jgi:hypothetical protein
MFSVILYMLRQTVDNRAPPCSFHPPPPYCDVSEALKLFCVHYTFACMAKVRNFEVMSEKICVKVINPFQATSPSQEAAGYNRSYGSQRRESPER